MNTFAEALHEYANLISYLAEAAEEGAWIEYNRVNTEAHAHYQDVVVPLALEVRP